ncbi:hypothetical protein ACIBSW_40425 [Actinoplanes sp. NPDC049668]|uniref:hypothetical protein n=1 Tax=unclassified Actinoplanes TaxID=2626549 RepID=UPI0033B1F3BC
MSKALRIGARLVAAGALVAGGAVVVASPAAAAVPGLVRISATSPSNSDVSRSITATCPAGKQLLGTGYEIHDGFGKVVVNSVRPNGSPKQLPTAVTVSAQEGDSTAGNWSVTAYATCANPVPGMVKVSATSASDSEHSHSAEAYCPTGKSPTGFGFHLNGTGGDAHIFVLSNWMARGDERAKVGVWARETDPIAGNWTLTAYALCTALPGVQAVWAASGQDGNDFHTATARCPEGKVMTTAGFDIQYDVDNMVSDDLRLNGGNAAAPNAVTASAYKQDPSQADWRIVARGMCVNA